MTTETRPKAYSYLRFSTPEQRKGDSFRRQTMLAEAYANAHGLELDTTLTLHDLGTSAFRGDNLTTGKLGEFLKAVHLGMVPRGSYLLVESWDRMSRDYAFDAQQLLSNLCLAGITVITLADNRVYSAEILRNDPFRLMEAIVIMIRANEESATKSRRLRAAWESRRQACGEKPLSAKVPAWLTLDRTTGTLQIIPERAAVVSRIFQMHAEGVGQNTIAATLTREGVPTFSRAELWHATYIAKILDNPAVIGRLIPHTLEHEGRKKVRKPQQAVEGYFPSVVTPELFARVQDSRRGNRNPPHRQHQAGISSLFAGLAKCPECGSTMTRVSKGKGPKQSRPYFVCTKAKGGAGCTYAGIRQEPIETAFIEQIGGLLCRVPSGTGGLDQIILGLETAISETQDYIGKISEALISNPSSPVLSAKLREAEDSLDSLEREYRDALDKAAVTSGPLLEAKLKGLQESLEVIPLDKSRVNALLRQLLTSVVIDYRQGLLVLDWKQGGQSEVMYEFK